MEFPCKWFGAWRPYKYAIQSPVYADNFSTSTNFITNKKTYEESYQGTDKHTATNKEAHTNTNNQAYTDSISFTMPR